MEKMYTLESFRTLDLDTKSFIIEDLLPDQYYGRQTDLFVLDENVEYTEEISKQRDVLFLELIEELSVNLFSGQDVVVYDLEKNMLLNQSDNEILLNRMKDEGTITIYPRDKNIDPKLN